MKINPKDFCGKHGFNSINCKFCTKEQELILQGVCPDCEGEGEQGGQFCGGYWTCETCKGTGKYIKENK